MNIKRVFLIVLDSLGIGEAKDADKFGDFGTNTLKSISRSQSFCAENLKKLGLFNIDKIDSYKKTDSPCGAFARLEELSMGKDTTIGHWEISGIVSQNPLPTYPNGFPNEIIDEFEKQTGRKVLCNKPYSGTQVIADFGQEHLDTGALIVYTSADSVFQIAAHEQIVPPKLLYDYCKIARKILSGKHGVGRVIARPFIGEVGNFTRTSNRHDFSLEPPKNTLLDVLSENGLDVIAVGKIFDIFAGRGITEKTYTKNNADGIEKTLEYINKDFSGLCFVNLVDFDMVYGHRNNVDGYAEALSYFDKKLPEIISKLKNDDVLIITADHGCDPGYTKTTDHTRENVPLLMYGKNIKPVNLGTRSGFCDIAKTIADIFSVKNDLQGESFLNKVIKND